MRCLAALALLLAAPAAAQPDAARAADLEGRFIRALSALALDDDSSAVRLLDQVLAEVPADPTVLALRVEAALRVGDAAEAVYFGRQAVEADPDDAATWLGLASAYRTSGQLADAADALTRARRAAPDDLDVLTAIADLAAQQGDAGAERDALLALVRMGDTVGARLRLSTLAEAAGDRDAARVQAEAAARLAPTNPAVAQRLAALTDAPASRPAASRSATDADALLDRIDADPRDLEAWALALQALATAGDPRAAATADDALLLFPRVPSVLAAAAEAYASAGQPDDATAAARRGLDALDLVGDGLPDAAALRARLDAVLSR